MYVRNYGLPPRSGGHGGETAYLKTVNPAEEGVKHPSAESTEIPDAETAERSSSADIVRDASILNENPECVTVSRNETGDITATDNEGAEKEASTVQGRARFGEHGVPPQPLRRRRLPTKSGSISEAPISAAVGVSYSEQPAEKRGFPEASGGEPVSNILGDSASKDLYLPERSQKNIETPVKNGCDTEVRPEGHGYDRRTFTARGQRAKQKGGKGQEHLLSNEDILLGGLLLLLMNDHADDDILLILAFLFVSGLGGDNSTC
ncbi:MAG: hypothetical protein IJY04_08895 [Clostridia bacterium]|nr:hypothetical protein [Clostridia bacterium]